MVDAEEVGKRIGIIVAGFAAVGLGLGLTGYIGMDAAADTLMSGEDDAFGEAFVALIFLQSVFLTWFMGPVVALITGLVSSRGLDAKSATIANVPGAFVGFLVMVFIAVAVMGMAMPETADAGGGGGDGLLGDLLGTIVLAALPTTIVAGLVGASEKIR